MDKKNKSANNSKYSFLKWILLFAALLYIPAMVLLLSLRDRDNFIERYADAYTAKYAASYSDTVSPSDSTSDSDLIYYDFVVD